VSDGHVAWLGNPTGRNDVFFFDGVNTTQLTTGDYRYVDSVRVQGDTAIWHAAEGMDGDDYDIYVYDGVSVLNLTANETNDVSPDLWGSRIAWLGYDEAAEDYEVFLYDGQSVVQLTDNDYWESAPDVSGEYIAWAAQYQDLSGNFRMGVFVYDGVSTQQLIESDAWIGDLDVSGSTIVWSSPGAGEDSEIFVATIPEPDASRLAVFGMLITLSALRMRRRR
jgi:hypothetical protein